MQHLSFIEVFLLSQSLGMFVAGMMLLAVALKWRSSTLFLIAFAVFWVVGVLIVGLDFLHPNVMPYYGTQIATMVLLLLMVAVGFYLERTQPHLTMQSFET